MTKFKTRDKVRVREDLSMSKMYGMSNNNTKECISDDMIGFCGEIVTITIVHNSGNYYKISEDNETRYLTDEMFENGICGIDHEAKRNNTTKLPLGVIPRNIFMYERALELSSAIYEYLAAGKKVKLLKQLKPLFYKGADTVYDLFSGSGSVVPNFDSDNVVGNDLYSGKLLEKLRTTNYDDIINHVERQIDKFKLSKTNKEEYYVFKDYILKQKETNQLDLFTLGLFCFNGRLEFNNSGEVTSAFGKRDRSNVIKGKLRKWKDNLPNNCKFLDMDYIEAAYGIASTKEIFDEDIFVYVDPLYSITRTNGYNSETYSDEKLFEILDGFDELGIKWGMSNVFAHKGKTNHELIKFAGKYNTHYLDFDYANNNRSNTLQQELEQSNETVEVYITNY